MADETQTEDSASTENKHDRIETLEQQVETLLKRDAEHRQTQEEMAAQITTLEQANQQKDEDGQKLEERVEELEFEGEAAAMEGAEDESSEMERKFSIWGFMDLTLAKFWYNEKSPYTLYLPEQSFFTMTNINLYFFSRMTQTLSAIVEIRFSFLPQGSDVEYGYAQLPDSAYERYDSRVVEPFTSMWMNQGGITIERAHLTYEPVDWLNFIVGRYITPYGIWNIDHGSTVVIPARIPYMQIREMMVLSQTGVQVYGRFFPSRRLFIDYAMTLSNGRGPAEATVDLDENKAVGLRLRMYAKGKKIKAQLGGYAYYGTYTNRSKVLDMSFNSDMTLDQDADNPVTVENRNSGSYSEFIVTADLLIEAFGFRLQSEYIHRYAWYQTKEMMGEQAQVFAGGRPSPLDTFYWPNWIGDAMYCLLAYKLPLDPWIAPVRIRPYFSFEYNVVEDTREWINLTGYVFGLNVEPSPFVTIKAEGAKVIPHDDIMGEDMWTAALQIAVSF